jgi:hypothetical protein
MGNRMWITASRWGRVAVALVLPPWVALSWLSRATAYTPAGQCTRYNSEVVDLVGMQGTGPAMEMRDNWVDEGAALEYGGHDWHGTDEPDLAVIMDGMGLDLEER